MPSAPLYDFTDQLIKTPGGTVHSPGFSPHVYIEVQHRAHRRLIVRAVAIVLLLLGAFIAMVSRDPPMPTPIPVASQRRPPLPTVTLHQTQVNIQLPVTAAHPQGPPALNLVTGNSEPQR